MTESATADRILTDAEAAALGLPHGPELEAVTDADAAWFREHPRREFRLRPITLAEVPAGETVLPKTRILVAQVAPGVRLRVAVLPPARLDRDTDRCCRGIVRMIDAEGCNIDGLTLGRAIRKTRAAFAEERASTGARETEVVA